MLSSATQHQHPRTELPCPLSKPHPQCHPVLELIPRGKDREYRCQPGLLTHLNYLKRGFILNLSHQHCFSKSTINREGKTRALSKVHAGKRGLPLQTPSHSPVGQWLLTANEQTIVQSPQTIKLVTLVTIQASHPRFLSPPHWRYRLAYRVTFGLSAIPWSRLVA